MQSRLARTLLLALAPIAFGVPAAAAQRGAPRWRAVRELVIGAEDTQALSEVSDIAVGAEGRIYVVQPAEKTVRVFAPDGRFVRTIGRRGSGPGELRAPGHAGWRGDTLVVIDPYRVRVTGFLPDGRYAFTLPFVRLGGFLPRALLADGRVLGSTPFRSDAVASGRTRFDEMRVTTRAARGSVLLARLALRNQTAHVHLDPAGHPVDSYLPQPFSDADLSDVDPQGRAVVVLSRPAPEAKHGTFTVTRYEPDGRSRVLAAVRYIPETLRPAMVNDTVAHYAAMFEAMPELHALGRARVAAAVRRALYVPRTVPAALAVVAGGDETVWVLRSRAGQTARWMVFDRAGRLLAVVELPSALAVYAASRGHVWGVVHDADDVPAVHRYRLEPAGVVP